MQAQPTCRGQRASLGTPFLSYCLGLETEFRSTMFPAPDQPFTVIDHWSINKTVATVATQGSLENINVPSLTALQSNAFVILGLGF